MTDLDTLLRDYATTRDAEVEPITADEILSLATTRSLDDSSEVPDVGAGVRSRRWLAIAAVVALLALTIGAVAVLVERGGDEPVADESSEPSPTTVRLLELVPVDAEGRLIWIDTSMATETTEGSGTHPKWPAGPGGDADGWWGQLGIETGFEAWVNWGTPPNNHLVAIGHVDAASIDEAVRSNAWSSQLVVGEHRGVTTYAWGEDLTVHPEEMAAGTFPDLLSLRLAMVDDALVMTRTTVDLHERIDHVLDGAPSLIDELVTVDQLRALGDEARLGGQLWGPVSDWDRGHMDLFVSGLTLGRHAPPLAVLLADGQAPDTVAARLQPELDELVEQQTADWADDLRVTADARGEAVIVTIHGLDDTPADSDAAGEVVLFREDVRRTVFPELEMLTGYPLS